MSGSVLQPVFCKPVGNSHPARIRRTSRDGIARNVYECQRCGHITPRKELMYKHVHERKNICIPVKHNLSSFHAKEIFKVDAMIAHNGITKPPG